MCQRLSPSLEMTQCGSGRVRRYDSIAFFLKVCCNHESVAHRPGQLVLSYTLMSEMGIQYLFEGVLMACLLHVLLQRPVLDLRRLHIMSTRPLQHFSACMVTQASQGESRYNARFASSCTRALMHHGPGDCSVPICKNCTGGQGTMFLVHDVLDTIEPRKVLMSSSRMSSSRYRQGCGSGSPQPYRVLFACSRQLIGRSRRLPCSRG